VRKKYVSHRAHRERREEEKDLLTGEFELFFSVSPADSSDPERHDLNPPTSPVEGERA